MAAIQDLIVQAGLYLTRAIAKLLLGVVLRMWKSLSTPVQLTICIALVWFTLRRLKESLTVRSTAGALEHTSSLMFVRVWFLAIRLFSLAFCTAGNFIFLLPLWTVRGLLRWVTGGTKTTESIEVLSDDEPEVIAQRCQGSTLKGEQCKMKVNRDAMFCHMHKAQA